MASLTNVRDALTLLTFQRIKCMPFEVCCSKDDLLTAPKCGVSQLPDSERITSLQQISFAQWPWHASCCVYSGSSINVDTPLRLPLFSLLEVEPCSCAAVF